MRASVPAIAMSRVLSGTLHLLTPRGQSCDLLIEFVRKQMCVTAVSALGSAISYVGCDVTDPGVVLLPGRRLADWVATLNGVCAFADAGEREVVIEGAGFEARFITMRRDRPVPLERAPHLMTVDGRDLARGVKRAMVAVASDHNRPALSSILLEREEDGLCLVGLDGRQMSVATLEATFESDWPSCQVLVPAAQLGELAREMSDVEEVGMGVAAAGNYLSVWTESVERSLLLTSGEFPEWRDAVPSDHGSVAVVRSQALGEALWRVSRLADEEASVVHLQLSASEIRMSSETDELGSSRGAVPSELTGGEAGVRFGSRGLKTWLDAVGTEKVSVEVPSGRSRLALRCLPDDGSLYVSAGIARSG